MPSTWKWIKAVLAHEFRLESVLLQFSNPELFSESPWFPPALFVIYRLIATSCCIILTVDSVVHNPSYRWTLQFESWSISAVCAYFSLSTCLLVYSTFKEWRENIKTKEDPKHTEGAEDSHWFENDDSSENELLWNVPGYEEDERLKNLENADRLSCCHKIIWLLRSIAQSSILVVIACYVLLENHVTLIILAGYISFAFFLFADAIFSFAPIRLSHTVYALLFSLIYVLLIFVLYFVLDVYHEMADLPRFVGRVQSDTSSILVLVILFIGQPLFQMFYFIVHKLNTLVYIKYYGY